VKLKVLREQKVVETVVRTASRGEFTKAPRAH
jgi:hypothetical protein